ncbi:unnamed protein product [Rhizoctonia solani]|uniref:DUF6532 domain-containing protein n=1 Tax=Rhizoctonia solani TaxID=456999 RepID=A0A8H3GHL0_9AGAM|nr:unnamed protein product [Rhizoctonia solani]
MPRSARDYVNSLRNDTLPDSDARPDTTEPSGNNDRVGLYDYPPEDPRSREHVTGRRSSRSRERNAQYRATRDHEEQQRRRSNDTRARNASLQWARIQDPPSQTRPSGDEAGEPDHLEAEEIRSVGQRGRSRTTRTLSRSPSPGSTDGGDEQPTQASRTSQYTYKYETLDHQGLVNCAQEEFGLDLHGCDTQTIIDRIRFATAEQASQVGSTRRPASIVLLPSTPFRVGGGWSQEVLRSSQSTGLAEKRSFDAAELSGGSSKRQRKHIVVDDDTATEPETEDEPVQDRASVRVTAENLLAGRPAEAPRPPGRGALAPPPSLEATPPTDLDSLPSDTSSRSLGGSLARYGVSLAASEGHSSTQAQPPLENRSTSWEIGMLPRLLTPLIGPVHARLRRRLVNRALHGTDREGSQARPLDVADQADDRQPTGTGQVPEIEFASRTNTPRPAPQKSPFNSRTYRGHRSHVQSEPEASHAETAGTSNEDEPAPPSSPNLTSSQLIRRERARAFAAKAHQEMAEMAPRRRPLFAASSQPPTARPQSRPPPRGNQANLQRTGAASRRLDPISAAREDMLAFNRAPFCAVRPPLDRRGDGLLEDDEKMLAQAEAYAKRKWPRRSVRVRKPKPVERDISGLARQVLVMAKIHLFAYALVEGVYQTRATYLRWAALVHQATWEMDLPDHPYTTPDDDIYEIMVNGIATLRGKVKERLREFVARVSGFRHTTTNHKIIEKNLVLFNRLYPNSFHCNVVNPRSGDYESPEIGHCIALALFNGPNSVGVLYPDYFEEMPLTVVAFALAIWQFCLEEWANGWRQNGDLGMAAMQQKYEAQLTSLKDLREVAPRRMRRLQSEWNNYVVEYSGAAFEQQSDASPAQKNQMRPDTPEPEAISVEEMEA